MYDFWLKGKAQGKHRDISGNRRNHLRLELIQLHGHQQYTMEKCME